MSGHQIIRRRLDTLREDPANPRSHDEANLRAIEASLRAHGQVEALLVQASTSMVIAGNGRLTVMRDRLGWTEADCVELPVSDAEARQLSIRLNRAGELAGWNDAVLAQHLRELQALGDWSPADLGWNDADLGQLYAGLEPAPAPAPAPAPRPERRPASPPPAPAPEPVPAPGPPAGPITKLPAGDARRLELYVPEAQRAEFLGALNELARRWGTDNVTDTILLAVQKHLERP